MQFSQEVITILDYLCGKFGIAIDWSSANITPYLKELCGRYILYEVSTSVAWCVLFTIIFIIIASIWKRIWKMHDNHFSEVCFFMTLVFAASTAVFIIVCAVQAFDIITCVTIPEKVLLEYVKGLLTTAKNSMGG